MHRRNREVAVLIPREKSYLKLNETLLKTEKVMTTQFNGTEFTTVETRRFAPAFEGAQAKRDIACGTLLTRRTLRRSRRENRAL